MSTSSKLDTVDRMLDNEANIAQATKILDKPEVVYALGFAVNDGRIDEDSGEVYPREDRLHDLRDSIKRSEKGFLPSKAIDLARRPNKAIAPARYRLREARRKEFDPFDQEISPERMEDYSESRPVHDLSTLPAFAGLSGFFFLPQISQISLGTAGIASLTAATYYGMMSIVETRNQESYFRQMDEKIDSTYEELKGIEEYDIKPQY